MSISEKNASPKISVEIRVFANLRPLTGFKIKMIQIPNGISMRKLFLEYLVNHVLHAEEFLQETLDFSLDQSTPMLKKYVKIILNGQILFTEHALDTRIEKDGSIIAIFPPVGGG